MFTAEFEKQAFTTAIGSGIRKGFSSTKNFLGNLGAGTSPDKLNLASSKTKARYARMKTRKIDKNVGRGVVGAGVVGAGAMMMSGDNNQRMY